MRKFIFIWGLILILLSSLSVSSQTVSEDTSQKEFEKEIEREVSAINAFEEGNWFISQKKYDKTIEMYRKATELKSDYAEAYNNWGWALGELGRYEEEIEKYKKARDLKPDYAHAWFNIACVYSVQKKKKEALDNLKKAIELDPAFKEKAKRDEDFRNLWEDEDFKRLVE